MSDEHKPHDPHRPDAGLGETDSAPVPAAEVHGQDVTAHGEDHPAVTGDHGQDDHAHDPDLAVSTASDAVPTTGDHQPDAATERVVEDHPVADAPSAQSHGEQADHDTTPAPVAGAAAVAAAGAARSPVWSDSGDAPFQDVDSTPVYARGKGGKSRKSKGSSSEGVEIFKTIFFALLIALVLRVLLFQPFTIPSASMEPALLEGDYIVVSKWSYGYSKHAIPFSPPVFEGRVSLPLVSDEPQRGDIVVFKLPRDNKTDYIKRLIGLPGDRIQMIANVLHINGAPLRNVVVTGQDVSNMFGMPVVTMRETLPEGRVITIQDFGPGNDLDDTPVFEVPAGHYFMMGDNRDNSIDSRVIDPSQGVGLVPSENLIGKAEIILFSWTPGASLWNPVSWFSNVRPSRFFTRLD